MRFRAGASSPRLCLPRRPAPVEAFRPPGARLSPEASPGPWPSTPTSSPPNWCSREPRPRGRSGRTGRGRPLSVRAESSGGRDSCQPLRPPARAGAGRAEAGRRDQTPREGRGWRAGPAALQPHVRPVPTPTPPRGGLGAQLTAPTLGTVISPPSPSPCWDMGSSRNPTSDQFCDLWQVR